MNNCDVTPPRRKTRFPRRRRNRFLHRDDEDEDENDATTMTPMRASFILARIMASAVADVFTNLNPIPSIRLVRERNESTLIATASNAAKVCDFSVCQSRKLVSISHDNSKYL